MKKLKKNNGITLIALVITIIVLLILVAISIATLTGENGILTKASTAEKQTNRQDVIERARIDILGQQANQDGKITESEAKAIIAKYDKDYQNDKEFTFKQVDGKEYILTKKGETILVKDIWDRNR